MSRAGNVVLALCTFSLVGLLPALASAAALIVDQRHARASDTNPGTEAAPLKTIGSAVAKVKPGDTILVKAGTYREEFKLPAGTAKAPVTLAAWKQDRPAIKGSEVVKGPWTRADVKPAYTGPEPVAIYTCAFEPYTQMVFVDEASLKQIGPFEYIGPKDQGTSGWENIVKPDGKGLTDMRPGTFFYDREAKRLYVWLKDSGDPAKHTVEAAVRFIAITLADYTHVKGFDVRHCQMYPRKGETAIAGVCDGAWLESCRVTYNDFAGVIIQGADIIMRDCELAYNGNCGLTSSYGTRMLFEGNTTHDNNTRRYAPGWQDGGMKVHEVKDSKFIRHHAYDEPGSGLWLDISCLNVTIADSLFENCGVGLYYEISRWGVIVNNVARHCDRGIWSYSSDVLIANNVVDRCGEGIIVSGDVRGAEYSIGYPDPMEMVVASTRNNMILNNLLIDCPAAYIGIAKDTIHSFAQWCDHNVFAWTLPVTHGNTNHIKFSSAGEEFYGRLAIWSMDRHFDTHSIIADPLLDALRGKRQIEVGGGATFVGDPMLVNRDKGDYRLKPGSPLAKAGLEVPQTIPSLYHPGIRPWVKTLVKSAPDPKTAVGVIEAWGQKHYRYQCRPAPRMMFAPETLKAAPVGLREDWSKTGNYPAFATSDQPEPPALEPKVAVYSNLLRDGDFSGQTGQATVVPPWVKASGYFHCLLWQAIVNLQDYLPTASGYQFVEPIKPGTRYTLWGYMMSKTSVSGATTTGRAYLAVGPATPPEGKALAPEQLTPVGDIAQQTAAENVTIAWQPFQAMYTSGAADADKNVGQGLYVVLDGKVAGPGLCPNGGNPNGQVMWDGLFLFSEQ